MAVSRYQSGYDQMMAQLRKMQKESAQPIPSEFQQVSELFAPGGKYGAGALTRIRQAQQAGVAGTMGQLIGAGMSSGALAAGVRSRYQREAETQMQQVEDVRYERLGQALSALGAAREARGIRMQQAFQSAAQLIQAYQTPLEQTALAGRYGLQQAGLQGAFQLAGAKMEQAGALQRQQQQQGWQSEMYSKYPGLTGANKTFPSPIT